MKKITTSFLTMAVMIISLCFFNLNLAQARDVSGVIASDTWENEQINVVGDLSVGNLIIKPGVTVSINGYYGIEIQGIVNAQGTKVTTIVFEPNSETGWKGIKFENTPNGSILKWCEIKGARGFGALQLFQSYPTITYCTFNDNQSKLASYQSKYPSINLGGAIFANIENQDLVIENCVFRNNKAEVFGGAISATSLSTGKIILRSNQFIDNQAGHTELCQNASGGAVAVKGNSQLLGNYFSDNRVIAYTIYTAAGRYTKGGALYTEKGFCEIIGNGFINNGCTMTAHGYTPDASFAFGGAIYQTSGSMTLKNSLIAENILSADRERYYRGSAVYIQKDSKTLMENNTIVANINAPAIYVESTVPKENVELINSILYFNFDSKLQVEGLLTASNCNIQGGYSDGLEITNVNPALDEYYQLMTISSLIDAGNKNSEYFDVIPPGFGTQINDLGFRGGPGAIHCLDYDGDGVVDCIEECINNSNKAYPDQCGCESADVDSDKDGTADCIDGCPRDPNKIKPGTCGCGKADTDTDKDGTLDCNDNCPSDPKKTQPGTCGCGVADTDTDKDGTLDCNDKCPSDPKKTQPGVCGCGVADTDTDKDGTPDCKDDCNNTIDTDKDGTPDCADKCPTDANKTQPGTCGCGKADSDTDSDGTPDCTDKCPSDPNKTQPGSCGCGISDIDTDKDGTLDCKDLCPNDPKKTQPGVCGCGVADTDTDKDGTPDCKDDCNNTIDTDKDGTPDCTDKCPSDPKKTQPGSCGCGKTDIDTDKDGVLDCNDNCPSDPKKTQPGVCGCGVADTDTDKDGTPDCKDDCNNLIDTDKDGTPDCTDKCPTDATKTQPGSCGCGNLDTDTDKDGTPDCIDLCPKDPKKTQLGACGCDKVDTYDKNGKPNCDNGGGGSGCFIEICQF